MYSYEEPCYETRDYFYNPPQNIDVPSEQELGGYGGSIRGYRSLSQIIPNYNYNPYGREYIPSRRTTRYMNLLGSICEDEEGIIPYDLNGNGTKISTSRGMGREFVRSAPPSENMHSYYPPIRQGEVKFEDTSYIPNELIPQMEYNDKEINDRKRKFEEENEYEYPMNWKLPASKSPIMEAMAFCAIQRWGIEISQCQDQIDGSPAKVVFRVLDFEKYYKYSCAICSKQNPTEDLGSRVKSLRRWFVNFPKKKRQKREPTILFGGKT